MEPCKMKITIRTVKRVWADVVVHRNKGDLSTRVRKECVKELPVGEEVEVTGQIEWTSNGYGSSSELIIYSSEDLSRRKEEKRQKEILHWIELFRNKANVESYYYERAVREVHDLGCTDYDDEFRRTKHDVHIRKWIGYFRENYKDGTGYIYERAVRELHAAGCRDYDNEIDEARRVISEKKAREMKERETREKAEGITCLRIPAYNGISSRPKPGTTLYHNDRLYRVISSYYHDADGYSFGVMNDEWCAVKAKDISSETEGAKELAAIRAENAKRKKNAELEQAFRKADAALSNAVRKNGSRYLPDKVIHLSDIPGKDLYDSFDAYGGGHLLRETSDEIILVINNGMDGDSWDMNNIRTGGAGAYGFACRISQSADELRAFKTALEAKRAAGLEA